MTTQAMAAILYFMVSLGAFGALIFASEYIYKHSHNNH